MGQWIRFKLVLTVSLLWTVLCGQDIRNRSFITGAYAGGYVDSVASDPLYNNMYVTVLDTGLHFSERFFCTYDLFGQSFTYNDTSGNAILHWQGCYLLDAETLEPIENGNFNEGIGYKKCEPVKPGQISNGYGLPDHNFILDNSANPDEKLLIYNRYDYGEKTFIATATVSLTGGASGGAVVTDKDYFIFGMVPIRYGSMQVIRHANGRDWYIVFSAFKTNKWYSVLYDMDGLHDPVESVIDQWNYSSDYDGQSSVSVDGSTYIYHAQFGMFIVMDFDRYCGTFTYRAQDEVPHTTLEEIGSFVMISRGGRYAYLSTEKRIWQYDLESEDLGSGRTLIAEFDLSLPSYLPWKGYFSCPFRGFNGHIYYYSSNGVPIIHKMEFPDRKGPDVGWHQGYYHTPVWIPYYPQSFVEYDTKPLGEQPCTLSSLSKLNVAMKLYPNPVRNIIKLECQGLNDNQLIHVNDCLGRVRWKGTLVEFKNGMDVSFLESGIYIMSGFDGQILKFVKI